jgi:hypothetical protein
MLYIVVVNNILTILNMKNWDHKGVYLVPIVAVEDTIHSYTNILYWNQHRPIIQIVENSVDKFYR